MAARSASSQPSPACPPARSELTLSHIGVWASGEWECSVSTVQGNASKKVEIVVLETSASYCPAERVANNRGDFRFGTTPGRPLPPTQASAMRVNSAPTCSKMEKTLPLVIQLRVPLVCLERPYILLYKITLQDVLCRTNRGLGFFFWEGAVASLHG